MKTDSQRINNLIGQLNGISKMVESDKDYMEIITQLKAVKSGVSSLIQSISETQLMNCLKLSESDRGICSRFVKEIVRADN